MMSETNGGKTEVDSEEEDDEYVPIDDDEDAAEDDKYEALEGGEDPDDPDCPKGDKRKGSKGSSTNKRKRRANDALLPGAKLMRRKGGICLSDDEDEPSSHPAEPAAEEEAVDQDDMNNDAQTSDKAVEGDLAKPKKSAVDDFWEEMKRGAEVKKPAAQAAKKDISSFINGLVSKSAGGSAAASKGGKVDVASLFPTSVTKKQTVKVEEKVDFAGNQVKITKEIEIGSKEHQALQQKKKGNLDDLVARLTGKQKSITTLTKTEHDWDGFKKEKGLEDELTQYRKNGYLEKVSFLKKTDEALEAQLKEQRQQEREVRARAQHAANLGPPPGV